MVDRTGQRSGGVHDTGPRPGIAAAGGDRRRGTAARPDPMDELVSICSYRSIAAIEAMAKRAFARWRLRMRRPPARASGRVDAPR